LERERERERKEKRERRRGKKRKEVRERKGGREELIDNQQATQGRSAQLPVGSTASGHSKASERAREGL